MNRTSWSQNNVWALPNQKHNIFHVHTHHISHHLAICACMISAFVQYLVKASSSQRQQVASCRGCPMKEIRLKSYIKLVRTDTTLDLSQKAEKSMICSALLLPYLYDVLNVLLHVGYLSLSTTLTLSNLLLPSH